jgi:DNA-binding NtrC family response regulator
MVELEREINDLLDQLIWESTHQVVRDAEISGYHNALISHEASLIVAALRACKGVQRQAAHLLSASASSLNQKIKRLGIDPSDYR